MTGLINLAFLVLGVLCIGVGTIVGFLRGFFKASLRLIRVALAAVLALPITAIITKIMGENAVALGSKVLVTFGFDLESESPNLAAASGSLLAAVSAVFVYFIVVVILLLVLLLITAFLKKNVGQAEKKLHIHSTASHGLGFLVGLLAGFLLFAVLTLPIVGVAHTANDTVKTLQQAQTCPLDADTLEVTQASTESVIASPICRLSWTFPQKMLYRAVTTVKTERGDSVLDEELHAAAVIADDVFVLVEATTFGSTQAKAVTHIASSLGETKMMPSLLAGFLSDASAKWLNGDTYFDMSAPRAKAPADLVLKGAYLLFSTTTPETIEKDLLTFADMLSSLDEAGLLDAKLDEKAILEKISNGSFFDRFNQSVDDRTQILNDSLLDAAIDSLAAKIGYTGSLSEARAQLEKYAGNVTALLQQTAGMQPDDRRAVLAENLSALGAELGFRIPVENADVVAEQLLARFGDVADASVSLTDYLSVLAAAAPSFIQS